MILDRTFSSLHYGYDFKMVLAYSMDCFRTAFKNCSRDYSKYFVQSYSMLLLSPKSVGNVLKKLNFWSGSPVVLLSSI